MPEHKLNITWDRFQHDTQALAWKLGVPGQFNSIICVTRGGLVPAAIVAKELDIRDIETICISSYDRCRQDNVKIIKDIAEYYMYSEKLLVVDDLVDTGETIKVVKERLPNAHVATVYAKPQGMPYVNTFFTEVSQDTWIVFPWE